MNTYSISDLEQLSGIKAHTIRIWEKRYNALKPKRSPGNIRYYDEKQLRRLLNIISISETGIKISNLFCKSDAEINLLLEKEIEKSKADDIHSEYSISQLIVSGLNYDELLFEKIFSLCIVHYGIRNTYIKIIYPMLVRIGFIWGKDDLCPAQEHFISNLIRQKLLAAIDSLPLKTKKDKIWILYLPEGENHEIGLLFAHYLIRSAGYKTIYLGSQVPFQSLKDSIHDNQPTDLLFFMTKKSNPAKVQSYLNDLSVVSPRSHIHFSGNKILFKELRLKKNMQWIQSVDQLEKEIQLKVSN